MAAVSSQPCTAWSGACSRAPPEPAPEPRAADAPGRHPAPFLHGRGGVSQAHTQNGWGGTGHSPTPNPGAAPARRARKAPPAPPQPMGNSEAGARQHPNSVMEACGPTRPPVAAALPRWRAAPSRPSRRFPEPGAPLRSLPPAPLTGGRSYTDPAARARTPSHALAPGAPL